MRPTSASPPRFSRLLSAAVMLLVTACNETTTPTVPSKLAFTIQPARTTAGTPIFPAVSVAVQDARGRTVTTATVNVTVAIESNPQSGSLSGTTSVAAVNGVATFPDLSINKAGTGYALSAVSPNLIRTASIPFDVTTRPPSRLAFTVQPVTTIARTAITPAVAVAVQDADGNIITTANNTITLLIGTNPANGTLSGTTTVAAVSGVATFSFLFINNIGTGYTLIALTSNLTTAASSAFDVTTGAASNLAFAVQPVEASPGATISPAVAVAVQDATGNTVPTASHAITVAIGTNPANGTLSGTTTVAAVNGVATFSNLSINNAGPGYTFTAAAANLSGGTSTAFNIRNPGTMVSVSAGYFHTCGLATGSFGYCWGENLGKLGNGATTQSSTPVPVSGGLPFASVSAGRDHTCGLTPGGVAYCWGLNDVGELGNGTTVMNITPVVVAGGRTFAAVSAGYSHTCGVTTSNAAYCWGDNSAGELGNSAANGANPIPGAVAGGLTFASVAPGRYFTCGVTTSRGAFCWGANESGELGNGTNASSTAPVAVSGGLSFALVSAGGFHACGLTPTGTAYCWGLNFYGELGNGAVSSSSTPVAVSGGLTFSTLSAGNRHTCGVTVGGVGYCWGDNSDGILGDGTTFMRFVPVAVAGGLTFARVSAGRFHSCGVTTSNAAYCWGNNVNGTLGDGTTVRSLVPLRIR